MAVLPDVAGIGCIWPYLVALVDSFQLLRVAALHFEGIERQIDRIEQPGSLQVVDPGQVTTMREPEMGKEAWRRCVSERPPRNFAAARRADPPGLHQHIERAFRNLDATNCLDLGTADRLVIGNDRERLDPGT